MSSRRPRSSCVLAQNGGAFSHVPALPAELAVPARPSIDTIDQTAGDRNAVCSRRSELEPANRLQEMPHRPAGIAVATPEEEPVPSQVVAAPGLATTRLVPGSLVCDRVDEYPKAGGSDPQPEIE